MVEHLPQPEGRRAALAARARRSSRSVFARLETTMTAPAPDFELDALDPTLYVRGVAHDVFD